MSEIDKLLDLLNLLNNAEQVVTDIKAIEVECPRCHERVPLRQIYTCECCAEWLCPNCDVGNYNDHYCDDCWEMHTTENPALESIL